VRCARERKRSGLNIIEDKMASPCLKIGMFRTATRQDGGGGGGEGKRGIKKKGKVWGNVRGVPRPRILGKK